MWTAANSSGLCGGKHPRKIISQALTGESRARPNVAALNQRLEVLPAFLSFLYFSSRISSQPSFVGFMSHSSIGSNLLPPGYQITFMDLNSNSGSLEPFLPFSLGKAATNLNFTSFVPGGTLSTTVNCPTSVAPSSALASTEVSACLSSMRPKTPGLSRVFSMGLVILAVTSTHRACKPKVTRLPFNISPLSGLQTTSSYLRSDIGIVMGPFALLPKSAHAGIGPPATAAAPSPRPSKAPRRDAPSSAC
mmetsp:Transcript_1707/g.4246  ORF Transcript_1707/g.4246 Transcript_1707/m.4246 type:complete len:249 (-) Transcript_1707:172-918(-)